MFIDHDGHMVDKNDRLALANIEKIMEKVTKFHLEMIMHLRKEGK